MDLKIGSHTQPSWPRANPKELYGSKRESLVFPDRRVSGVSIPSQAKKGRTCQNCPLWSHPSYTSGNPAHALFPFRKQPLLPPRCEGLQAGLFGNWPWSLPPLFATGSRKTTRARRSVVGGQGKSAPNLGEHRLQFGWSSQWFSNFLLFSAANPLMQIKSYPEPRYVRQLQGSCSVWGQVA